MLWKWVAIPFWRPFTLVVTHEVSEFLTQIVPEWLTFDVASCCEYLGFPQAL